MDGLDYQFGSLEFDIAKLLEYTLSDNSDKFDVLTEENVKKREKGIMKKWEDRLICVVPPGFIFEFESGSDLEKFKKFIIPKSTYDKAAAVEKLSSLISGSQPFCDEIAPVVEQLGKFKGFQDVLMVKPLAKNSPKKGERLRTCYYACKNGSVAGIRSAISDSRCWREDCEGFSASSSSLMRQKSKKNEIIGFEGGAGSTSRDLKHCLRMHLRAYKLRRLKVLSEGTFKKRGRWMAGWKTRKFAVVPPGYLLYFRDENDYRRFNRLQVTKENYENGEFHQDIRKLVLGTCPVLYAPKELRRMNGSYKGEKYCLTIKIDTDKAHRRFYFALKSEKEADGLKRALADASVWGEEFAEENPGIDLDVENSDEEIAPLDRRSSTASTASNLKQSRWRSLTVSRSNMNKRKSGQEYMLEKSNEIASSTVAEEPEVKQASERKTTKASRKPTNEVFPHQKESGAQKAIPIINSPVNGKIMRNDLKKILRRQSIISPVKTQDKVEVDDLKARLEKAIIFNKMHTQEHEYEEHEESVVDPEDIEERTKKQRIARMAHWIHMSTGIDPEFEDKDAFQELMVWRADGFGIQPWAPGKYGIFNSGDCYLVLNPSLDEDPEDDDEAAFWDLYFWIGNECSKDKPAIIAIKIVELAGVLRGHCSQRRELQGEESFEFTQVFDKFEIRDGGSDCALRAVQPEEKAFDRSLMWVKGTAKAYTHYTKLSLSSLNSGDVFILDTWSTLYIWVGEKSNRYERLKAAQVSSILRERITKHSTYCDIKFLNEKDTCGDHTLEEKVFARCLGGDPTSVDEKNGDDEDVQNFAAMFEVSKKKNQEPRKKLIAAGGDFLSKKSLRHNRAYVLDGVSELFVWFGRNVSRKSRKEAESYAKELLNSHNRPKWTPKAVMHEGCELPLFKMKFSDWYKPPKLRLKHTTVCSERQDDLNIENSHRSDISDEDASTPINHTNVEERKYNGASDSDSDDEYNVPESDNGDEDLDEEMEEVYVYRVNNNNETEEIPSDGTFYSDKAYIVVHNFEDELADEKEDENKAEFIERTLSQKLRSVVYFWKGKHCPTSKFKIWKYELTSTIADFLETRIGNVPDEMDVFQGREPLQFLNLFDEGIVVKRGKDSEDYDGKENCNYEDSTILYQAWVNNNCPVYAAQVDCVPCNLNSGGLFVAVSANEVYAWYGRFFPCDQRDVSVGLLDRLMENRTIAVVDEGEEPAEFWELFEGSTRDYAKITDEKDSLVWTTPPRMFSCSSKRGRFIVQEIGGCVQYDLSEDSVILVDGHAMIFIWSGSRSFRRDAELTEQFVRTLLDTTPDRSQDLCKIIRVQEGEETHIFKSLFKGWSDSSDSRFIDPYASRQKSLEDRGLVGYVVN